MVLALTNVTNRVCSIVVQMEDLDSEVNHWFDLVSQMEWFTENGKLFITLNPYDVLWLTPFKK
jgi:hypothetical protein